MLRIGIASLCLLLLFTARPFGDAALGADLTGEQVRDALAHATADHPADFAGKSLEKLDLSKLNFTGAKLAGANLFGTNLTEANFTDADLSGASLDLAWVMRTNFTRAKLVKASLQGLVVSLGMETSAAQAPILPGADLSGASCVGTTFLKIIARGVNWTDADLTKSCFVEGCDLEGVRLVRANLSGANLRGSKLAGARLTRSKTKWSIISWRVKNSVLSSSDQPSSSR